MLITNQGRIGIEVNSEPKSYLHVRNLAFLCDNYAHYTLKGSAYLEDIRIIQINFTYGLPKKDKELLRTYGWTI